MPDPTPASLARAREIDLGDRCACDGKFGPHYICITHKEIVRALDAVWVERDAVIAERNREIARSLEIQAGVLAEMDQMRTAIEALGADLTTARATIARLNRRCQQAEGALGDKLTRVGLYHAGLAMYAAQVEEAHALVFELESAHEQAVMRAMSLSVELVGMESELDRARTELAEASARHH